MPLRSPIVLMAGLLFFSQSLRAQKPGFDTTEIVTTGNVPLNAISTRAVRHFIKHFPNVHDEQWFITNKGFIATFTDKAEMHRIYYNQRGGFRLSVVAYYEGKYFPEALKRLVSIGYPGSEIDNIVELFNGSERLYGITISDHQFYRLIEYTDDETKVVDEYNKQM